MKMLGFIAISLTLDRVLIWSHHPISLGRPYITRTRKRVRTGATAAATVTPTTTAHLSKDTETLAYRGYGLRNRRQVSMSYDAYLESVKAKRVVVYKEVTDLPPAAL